MKPESGWTGNLQLCLEGYQAVRFAVPTPAGLCALCWGFVIIPECQRGSLSLGPRARTRVEMVLMKSHHLDHGTATAWPCVLTTCNPPAVIPIPADQLCPVLVAQREPAPAAEHPMLEQGRGLFSISLPLSLYSCFFLCLSLMPLAALAHPTQAQGFSCMPGWRMSPVLVPRALQGQLPSSPSLWGPLCSGHLVLTPFLVCVFEAMGLLNGRNHTEFCHVLQLGTPWLSPLVCVEINIWPQTPPMPQVALVLPMER